MISLKNIRVDGPLLCGIVLLSLAGFLVLYSAGDQDGGLILRRAVHLGIALALMLGVTTIPLERLSRLSPWAYLGSLALLVLVLYVGETGKGAQRWLSLGGVRFQPSELMKLALPMVIAWQLGKGKESPVPSAGQVIVTLLLIALPVWLAAQQPDLGTAVLIGVIGFSVLFVAGINRLWLGGFAAATLAAAPILWGAMHPYQQKRVLTFLNPEQDPLGTGYHIIQSQIAIGSGGLYGKGWLNGTQSHLEFLPERSTDFVFAVLSEEFGAVGVLALACLYLFIIGRGLYIASRAQQVYGKLLATGVIFGFFIYTLVNISMVSGWLPVVGVPLPLISHGGTSMITIMMGFGILMSIHADKKLLPG